MTLEREIVMVIFIIMIYCLHNLGLCLLCFFVLHICIRVGSYSMLTYGTIAPFLVSWQVRAQFMNIGKRRKRYNIFIKHMYQIRLLSSEK